MSLSGRFVVLSEGGKIPEGSPDLIAADHKVIDVYLGKLIKSDTI